MVNSLGATDYQTGSTGANVFEIQSLLTQRGYSPGPVDGSFGPQTKPAVQRFQSDRGITIDGIVGPVTWNALHGNLPSLPPPASLPKVNVSPLPTELVLYPGSTAQIVPGTSPIKLVFAGLGLLTLVTMMGRKKR